MKHGGHHDGAVSGYWSDYGAGLSCPAHWIDIFGVWNGSPEIDDITIDRNINDTGWEVDFVQVGNPAYFNDIDLVDGDQVIYRLTGRWGGIRVTETLTLPQVSMDPC